MSIWNLDNDTLEPGQWINKKVLMRNCDISPSGKYLIYPIDNFENSDYRDNSNNRTAICKPPFWTALTVWEHDHALFDTGGGLFADEKTVLLNLYTTQAHKEYPVPSDLNVSRFHTRKEYSPWKGHINLLHEHRLEMNGWTEQNDPDFIQKETEQLTVKNVSEHWLAIDRRSIEPIVPKLWKKSITNSTALYMITFYHVEHRKNVDLFYVGKKDKKTKLKGIKWADIDNRNRIIATMGGKLYASKIATDGSVDYTNLELLHDLNPLKPKSILTPLHMKSWDTL
ncbi:hypothetical protein [Flavobacterium cerinum]|uniref:Uncharacterized protein n=1 Tax=Flavobacterium cerinum TaxID=2502784 RepID=A0ABY5IQM7_9FLAO|nr:hypothetical protein [Flavobacterium cerinum]UUC45147.1 hypothetical protein NOX80_16170 [Flavobacterium cerinum]